MLAFVAISLHVCRMRGGRVQWGVAFALLQTETGFPTSVCKVQCTVGWLVVPLVEEMKRQYRVVCLFPPFFSLNCLQHAIQIKIYWSVGFLSIICKSNVVQALPPVTVSHDSYSDIFCNKKESSYIKNRRIEWHSGNSDTFLPSQHCHCKREGLYLPQISNLIS